MQDGVKQRRGDIELLRVVSMSCILLNHSITYLIPGTIGNFLHELFDIGIPLFLLISGFCYGRKIIERWGEFYAKRFERIIVPAYVVTALVAIGGGIAYHEYYSLLTYLMYVFNLQGFAFLCNLDVKLIIGVGPLWFVTVIMVCYGLLPLLQRIQDRHIFRNIAFFSFIISFVIQAVLGIRIYYFALFILGYYFSRFKVDEKISSSILETIVVFVLQIARVFLNQYEDILPWYVYVAWASISFALLGIWVFKFFLTIYQKYHDGFDRMAKIRLVKWLDRMSLYIYMVQLPLADIIFERVQIKPVGYSMWLVSVAFCAVILLNLCDRVTIITKKVFSKIRIAE